MSDLINDNSAAILIDGRAYVACFAASTNRLANDRCLPREVTVYLSHRLVLSARNESRLNNDKDVIGTSDSHNSRAIISRS